MQPPIVLFDDGLGRFGPMTDLRAAFEIRTGADTTARRVARWAGPRLAAFWAPARLAAVVAERSNLPVNVLPDAERIELLNGRLPLPEEAPRLRPGEAAVEEATGDLVAAVLDRRQAEAFLQEGALQRDMIVRQCPPGLLLRRPWDVLAALERTIAHDVLSDQPADCREARPAIVQGRHPVVVHASAQLWPGVVIDAEHGPVAVHADAVIRPHAMLCGPCAVGAGAVVSDGAVIRGRTVIGPMCKVGGEVSGVIFQGFANKAHDGFLGDSWVGKWVNIGAGTNNSNLLNTYGEVSTRLEPDGPRERTGRTFFGCLLGDHVKLAIGTRIMTGTVIGAGAMVASSQPPPAFTPAFAWITDEACDGTKRWRFDRFEATMRAMMARRARAPGAAYLAALEELWRSRQEGA